jgi:hypothetical protein
MADEGQDGARRRNPSARQKSDAARADRDANIWRLRLKGRSLRQIGVEVGLSHVMVREILEKGYDERIYPKVDEARTMELERLDEMQHAAWQVLERHHITVSHGKVVRDDDGETILDDGPVLRAIDSLLRVSDRRAKLLGLDAPTRVEGDHTHRVPSPELLGRIEAARATVEAQEAQLRGDEPVES